MDLHKRSWLGRASRVSPRGEPERRKLPGTAWICLIGSLLAHLFHGPSIVVTNVQTIAVTITPLTPPPLSTSHNESLFASSLSVRVVCSTLVILAWNSLYFQSSLLFYFCTFISAFVMHAGTFFWKLHESRITSWIFIIICKCSRLVQFFKS